MNKEEERQASKKREGTAERSRARNKEVNSEAYRQKKHKSNTVQSTTSASSVKEIDMLDDENDRDKLLTLKFYLKRIKRSLPKQHRMKMKSSSQHLLPYNLRLI